MHSTQERKVSRPKLFAEILWLRSEVGVASGMVDSVFYVGLRKLERDKLGHNNVADKKNTQEGYTAYTMSESTPKTIAIDILSRRDNSVREMKQKLKKKGIQEEDIEDTITWLQQKKLLDDRVFAQKKAESILRLKLCGPKYVENKLHEAGVSSEIIDDVISSIASEEEWEDRARQAIEQWKKIHPKHAEDRVRKMRFLASRGFDRIEV